MDPRPSWGGLLCGPKVAALNREQGLQTHLHDGFSFVNSLLSLKHLRFLEMSGFQVI